MEFTNNFLISFFFFNDIVVTKSKHSEYKEKVKGRGEKPTTSSMENSGKFAVKVNREVGW